ncbi:hypothetical protein TRV_02087 [Trichophyton verrucosum HKI 0517]|uniref:Uncharacterized protein n=1 Tax=Trichophyton verrucosum (strain HKI 0517) TaxID=663202 RepID=D4D4S1_TRIVH|nr:uncharacterized protein TRV_02087 [Trichophyton verrucosum HKI 0517]EFE43145.1 hypothetical protein TRV_02087 [Trichophyton verrucosum HKI 0517]
MHILSPFESFMPSIAVHPQLAWPGLTLSSGLDVQFHLRLDQKKASRAKMYIT